MNAPVRLGTPLSSSATRVLLLGSGELGKEVAIELQRFGGSVLPAGAEWAPSAGLCGWLRTKRRLHFFLDRLVLDRVPPPAHHPASRRQHVEGSLSPHR